MVTAQKRVLIVDDEEDLTWTLSKKLSKDSDKFQLICVNSGREAINVLSQLPVDLVITDVRMPEVSGLELLVEIKKRYPQTKVSIMTAYGSRDVQLSASERGCFHYIEKPFEINELRKLIIDALAEKRGFNGSVSDFQLSDIIQLNCLGRLTSALEVVHEHEKGSIYFDDGNIIHAETERLIGEKAFYYIMSWEGGEFFIKQNTKSPSESIRKGWQNLLLEAMRRLDESVHLVDEEKERVKQERLDKIHDILKPISKSRGVDFVLIHNAAGFPIFYLPERDDANLEATGLSDQLLDFFKDMKKLEKHLQTRQAEFVEIKFSDLLLLISKVPRKQAYFTIVGDESINAGLVRFEMRKTLKLIVDLV